MSSSQDSVLLRIQTRLQAFPWFIIILTTFLLIISLVHLYSVDPMGKFNDQLNWIILGSLLFFFVSFSLDAWILKQFAPVFYGVMVLCLLAVDILGKSAKGAERWLSLGPFRVQPSEFAKLATLIMVARVMVDYHNSKDLWKIALVIIIPTFLTWIQPDLGTASMILFIGVFQVFFLPIPQKLIIRGIGFVLFLIYFLWEFYFYDYQKQRILNFLNPMLDPKGTGYHSIQSMIAVGSGKFWGKGFRQGTQGQLHFLPERHTDFIFSVWAEEHGFLGCLVFFLLYGIFLIALMAIIQRMKDPFSSLVTLGIWGFFLLHFAINIGMVLGLFPVVGVPLSLMSYGGSHMMVCMLSLGIVVSLAQKK